MNGAAVADVAPENAGLPAVALGAGFAVAFPGLSTASMMCTTPSCTSTSGVMTFAPLTKISDPTTVMVKFMPGVEGRQSHVLEVGGVGGDVGDEVVAENAEEVRRGEVGDEVGDGLEGGVVGDERRDVGGEGAVGDVSFSPERQRAEVSLRAIAVTPMFCGSVRRVSMMWMVPPVKLWFGEVTVLSVRRPEKIVGFASNRDSFNHGRVEEGLVG